MWMYPLAIVCGNTFVLKPSERDPSSVMYIAQWLKEAGLPDGVMNVVNGKRCQALGGAKNNAIVMPDAYMDNTVNQLLGAAFGSSGKRCMAVAVGNEAADELSVG